MLICCSKIEASSLDSQMPMTAALVDIAVKHSFSIFDKLNIQANEM